jgi:hypothetical protein
MVMERLETGPTNQVDRNKSSDRIQVVEALVLVDVKRINLLVALLLVVELFRTAIIRLRLLLLVKTLMEPFVCE